MANTAGATASATGETPSMRRMIVAATTGHCIADPTRGACLLRFEYVRPVWREAPRRQLLRVIFRFRFPTSLIKSMLPANEVDGWSGGGGVGSRVAPSGELGQGAIIGQGATVKTNLPLGFHAAAGRAVDSASYDQFTGQWSRLFVPAVLDAADVDQGCRVLDVATGTGEAALAIAPVIGGSGFLVGVDVLENPCSRPRLDTADIPHVARNEASRSPRGGKGALCTIQIQ